MLWGVNRNPAWPGDGDARANRIGLSTSSVFPESTGSCFELAGRLGYDGVEVMVGIDPISRDVDALVQLREYHDIAVLAIHAEGSLEAEKLQTFRAYDPRDAVAYARSLAGLD